MSNSPIIESQDRQALRALLEAALRLDDAPETGSYLPDEFRAARHEAVLALSKADPLAAQLQDAEEYSDLYTWLVISQHPNIHKIVQSLKEGNFFPIAADYTDSAVTPERRDLSIQFRKMAA